MILQVSAYDGDEGINDVIIYSITGYRHNIMIKYNFTVSI